MPQDTRSRHLDQFLVRFPDGMRDKIAAAAKESGRSMNAEIVSRIEMSFIDAPPDSDEFADKLAQSLIQRLMTEEAAQAARNFLAHQHSASKKNG